MVKCSKCGSEINVFNEIIFDKNNNKYKIRPTCIKCKQTEVELDNWIAWESKLNNIENFVATQLITKKYPNIKFKNYAIKAIEKLMKTYSIRCVFEVCINSGDTFNYNLIAKKCKEKFLS